MPKLTNKLMNEVSKVLEMKFPNRLEVKRLLKVYKSEGFGKVSEAYHF